MILVAGSANLDFVVRVKNVPLAGETVLGSDAMRFPGGKGANQAVACARAGAASVGMMVALGEDDFANALLPSLTEAGVQLCLQRSQRPTGTAFICVSEDGENAITVAPGANDDLKPQAWPQEWPVTHLLMQLETPIDSVLALAKMAHARGVTVVLNAAPARNISDEMLDLVDVLIVNQGELDSLMSMDRDSFQKYAQFGKVKTLIVTMGAKGCMAWHQGGTVEEKAFPIKPIDTTCAGDTFCGALVAGLERGLALRECMREASAAAALACLKMGAQTSIPHRDEVLALIGNTPLDGSPEQSKRPKSRITFQ